LVGDELIVTPADIGNVDPGADKARADELWLVVSSER
jgi:hypothetical protein